MLCLFLFFFLCFPVAASTVDDTVDGADGAAVAVASAVVVDYNAATVNCDTKCALQLLSGISLLT